MISQIHHANLTEGKGLKHTLSTPWVCYLEFGIAERCYPVSEEKTRTSKYKQYNKLGVTTTNEGKVTEF
jgi:hypothetical protein